MDKTLDHHFIDWESVFLGFGYGSGEEHIIPVLKAVFAAIPPDLPNGNRCYHYERLEDAVGPVSAWFTLNLFGQADIIEYGTSPRFGWLTPHGYRLKSYFDSKTVNELLEVLASDYDGHCYPDHCNCFEGGPCHNPFWVESRDRTRSV